MKQLLVSVDSCVFRMQDFEFEDDDKKNSETLEIGRANQVIGLP